MKKLIFILIFLLGLIGGLFAFLHFTDYKIVKKYVTHKIPDKFMSKIPDKIKHKVFYTEEEFLDITTGGLGEPLDVPKTKFDTEYVSNDNPIFEAFRKGNKEDIIKTINLAENVDIFDITGRTPLMYSAFRDDTDIAELIISKGADVNFKDRWGHTAIMYAAKYGNEKIVDYFINQGADINAVGTDGETPVSAAAFEGNIDILNKFIDAGADVNLKDDYGNTPIMKAAVNGNKKATETLIKYGADLNIQNKDGLTAAMLASESGRYDAAKAIFDAGADLTLQDNAGETALDHARKFGHDHIEALIKQYLVIDDKPVSVPNNYVPQDPNSNIIMH